MNSTNSAVKDFALRFLRGRIVWRDVPRLGITNFGTIISMLLYRQSPFQVELFIVPHQTSSFTIHRHPDVDTVEFLLTGNSWLKINGESVWTPEQRDEWLKGLLPSRTVDIGCTDWHEGGGSTPYAFLSIQHWLNNVEPSSVGLNWEGDPTSVEQEMLWLEQVLPEHQIGA